MTTTPEMNERIDLPAQAGRLEQQLQNAERALVIAIDALGHCETAAPELTGDVLDVIETLLPPETLVRIYRGHEEVADDDATEAG